jgi:hypothetical protein
LIPRGRISLTVRMLSHVEWNITIMYCIAVAMAHHPNSIVKLGAPSTSDPQFVITASNPLLCSLNKRYAQSAVSVSLKEMGKQREKTFCRLKVALGRASNDLVYAVPDRIVFLINPTFSSESST